MATKKTPKAKAVKKVRAKRVKTKLTLPKVLAPLLSTKGSGKETDAFPVDHYSASSMIKFSTNPILFKILYMNCDRFETTSNISSIIGQAFHTAMEVYYGGVDELKPTNEQEAIKFGLHAGMTFIENYLEGFINYSKRIPTKEKAYEIFAFVYNSYIQETTYDPEQTVSTEEKIEEQIDVMWRDEQRLRLPVKMKGYIDRILRKDGKLKIKDYKTCSAFSNDEKIDGAKIIQAVIYYLLVFAKYGEAPYSVIFEEVKTSKNSDGSPQVRQYEMVFSENELYFDFFFRFYRDMTRALNGEMVFVPNVHTMFDNEVSMIAYIHRLDEVEEKAKLMRKHKVSNVTDLLKKEMQSAGNMRKFLKIVEEEFVTAKNMDYSKMEVPERIEKKLMTLGVRINFEGVIYGASVDLYRYSPSIGLKMSKVKNFVSDIEQVLGVTGVRILAPMPNSTMIGFEVPRSERTFPEIPDGTGFDVAIGQTIMGEARRFDIRSAPHMLVAGATGSGKSVFLNTLIEQLSRIPNTELYLYDPKMVELLQFKGRVHEYADTAEGIIRGLLKLEEEMDARYRAMANKGVRNISETSMPYKFVVIDEFGDFILQARDTQKEHESINYSSRPKPWLLKELKQRGLVENLDQMREEFGKGDLINMLESDDENNPLLDVDVEKTIVRLAQKARACGIHMILATQRPSVDVISGGIKTNFPTKVVFRTSKEIDSRIVIDEAGAEKLLGKGDMLFVSETGIERLQGFNTK